MRATDLLPTALGLFPPSMVERCELDPDGQQLDICIDISPAGEFPSPECVRPGWKAYDTLKKSWRRARERLSLVQVRVHDLTRSFGQRLRAKIVSFEDTQDLLGRKSDGVSTHYTSAELGNLISAADHVYSDDCHKTDTGPLQKKTLLGLVS